MPISNERVYQLLEGIIFGSSNGNTILDRTWGYISLYPYCVDVDASETAIVDTRSADHRKFYILKGDHLNQLEHLTLKQCMKYWRERPWDWGYTTDTEDSASRTTQE